ncbi:uncharacterized protein DUF2075 [Humitalea rosea]|uniref:Uncharacterized protein DUF2075 n=1 Tax=Humitalea rosea TaxID=990373 RepID=A0A2W7HVI4_9PROT|nr:DUF2075 domain-containing protein [Humitalea rosea]PZW38656.1 uncharacterized protein DUF2075 [Humitalea rosea]
MTPWFACTGQELLATATAEIVGRLAVAQSLRLAAEAGQTLVWTPQIEALKRLVADADGAAWTIALEYDLMRLEKRADAVIVTPKALLVLEFKTGRADPAAFAQAEDYALDLRDFHSGSRDHPIIPLVVASGAGAVDVFDPPLIWHGVLSPIATTPAALPALVAAILATAPEPFAPLDGPDWIAAPYRPVPHIVEAATLLYARNGVAAIAAARADLPNLTRTTAAIARHVDEARRLGQRRIVFVTGIPGAGKTLCGLNTVFGPARQEGAAFLTGNAPLVAVLREALARDAIERHGTKPSEARRRTKMALQNVHRFLEDNLAGTPPEHVIVFDEAQRAWDQAQATRDTLRRASRLTMSEPAHTLAIMARVPGWAVIVALIGNGQEINTGEAGLAEWGRVIAEADGLWQAIAAERVITATDPVQRLSDAPAPWLTIDPDLDLTVPVRSVTSDIGAAWVEAVLDGDAPRAAAIALAEGGVPFFVTRDLADMRAMLRGLARGLRRAGLVASSGARRLRAEGLGVEVGAADNAPDWFLRRWPDVRGSDALEVVATEYTCQGLELDVVGLAWGGDLVRDAGAWAARSFAGTRWNRVTKAQDLEFVRNTYRVLLTRARYETVVYVPAGEHSDPTRDPAQFDAVATFLLRCGARPATPVLPASDGRNRDFRDLAGCASIGFDA